MTGSQSVEWPVVSTALRSVVPQDGAGDHKAVEDHQ